MNMMTRNMIIRSSNKNKISVTFKSKSHQYPYTYIPADDDNISVVHDHSSNSVSFESVTPGSAVGDFVCRSPEPLCQCQSFASASSANDSNNLLPTDALSRPGAKELPSSFSDNSEVASAHVFLSPTRKISSESVAIISTQSPQVITERVCDEDEAEGVAVEVAMIMPDDDEDVSNTEKRKERCNDSIAELPLSKYNTPLKGGMLDKYSIPSSDEEKKLTDADADAAAAVISISGNGVRSSYGNELVAVEMAVITPDVEDDDNIAKQRQSWQDSIDVLPIFAYNYNSPLKGGKSSASDTNATDVSISSFDHSYDDECSYSTCSSNLSPEQCIETASFDNSFVIEVEDNPEDSFVLDVEDNLEDFTDRIGGCLLGGIETIESSWGALVETVAEDYLIGLVESELQEEELHLDLDVTLPW